MWRVGFKGTGDDHVVTLGPGNLRRVGLLLNPSSMQIKFLGVLDCSGSDPLTNRLEFRHGRFDADLPDMSKCGVKGRGRNINSA